MSNQKTSVFISYSHRDRSICDSIASLIEKPSRDIWYDKGLIPGEIYRKKIVEKIQASDYFVVLLSGESIRSEWVIDEVEYAKKQHKRILPIFLQKITLPSDLDMILQRYHCLFWYLRNSDSQFKDNLDRVFEKGEGTPDIRQTGEAFNSGDFSESEIAKMRRMLDFESRGVYSECYTAEGACLLGKAYLYGSACAEDRKKAGFYFRIAKYNGSLDARAYLLQIQLEDQETSTWDEPDEAFCTPVIDSIKSLADQGSEAAMMLLAHYLWYGRYGCEKDYVQSAALYEICAKKGNARAQYLMSVNYYYGDGVPKDYDLAIMFAHLALEQKYIKAWRRLGKFYRDGLAVPRDYQKAKAYYEKGAQAGDYNCYNKLGDMYYYGWGFEVNYQTAFSYYLKGEQAPENGQKYGLWKAKQALGRCYELGHGTEQDAEIATEKYMEGYRLGSDECKKDYVRLAGILKGQRQESAESDPTQSTPV